MATPVLLPKLSPKANWESLEMPILDLELQARKATETAKLEWEAKFRHLEKVIKEKDDALHQKNEALREKDGTVIQLTKAPSLKDYAIKQKDLSLEKALSELQFERQALMAAETRKADLEAGFEQYKLYICNELNKMNDVARQRDDALYQKEIAYRDREIIAQQLDEALKLQEDANGKEQKILQKRNDQIQRRWKSYSRWTRKSLALFCCNFGEPDMESRPLL